MHGIMQLHEAMKMSFDPKLQLSQREWQHSGICVTQNVFETVLIKDLGSKAPNSKTTAYMCAPSSGSSLSRVEMCYLREAAYTKYEKGVTVRLALPETLPDGNGCEVVTMAGLQLLAGETMFGPSGTENREAQVREARLSALAKLQPTPEAKKAALSLPFLRDKHQGVATSKCSATSTSTLAKCRKSFQPRERERWMSRWKECRKGCVFACEN